MEGSRALRARLRSREGTLNVDVIDAARRHLVWGSVVTESMTQELLDNVPEAIDAAVAAASARYPVPAPAPAPAPVNEGQPAGCSSA